MQFTCILFHLQGCQWTGGTSSSCPKNLPVSRCVPSLSLSVNHQLLEKRTHTADDLWCQSKLALHCCLSSQQGPRSKGVSLVTCTCPGPNTVHGIEQSRQLPSTVELRVSCVQMVARQLNGSAASIWGRMYGWRGLRIVYLGKRSFLAEEVGACMQCISLVVSVAGFLAFDSLGAW